MSLRDRLLEQDVIGNESGKYLTVAAWRKAVELMNSLDGFGCEYDWLQTYSTPYRLLKRAESEHDRKTKDLIVRRESVT